MSGVEVRVLSVGAARAAWVEHRFFKYRGCAGHPDDPQRMAGNFDLPVGAHHGPDAFVVEGQKERRAREDAAQEVCLNCPVMVACDRYASSVTSEGRLAEPDGVWGGRTGLERHKALIRARHAAPAAPDRRFETPQKRAVLRAFAVVWEPCEVAVRAGVDVRTANWQRSNLTTLLGLPRTASRREVLTAAGERGLLEGVSVVADDGSVPAVPPPPPRTADSGSRVVAPVVTSAVPAPGPTPTLLSPSSRSSPSSSMPSPSAPVPPGAVDVHDGPIRLQSPRRDRFADIVGQLALWEAELADVHRLFPADTDRLGAAA